MSVRTLTTLAETHVYCAKCGKRMGLRELGQYDRKTGKFVAGEQRWVCQAAERMTTALAQSVNITIAFALIRRQATD